MKHLILCLLSVSCFISCEQNEMENNQLLLFGETGNYNDEIRNYNKLASAYLIKEAYDSALFYYDKVLTITTKQADNTAHAYALKNKGVVLLHKGDFGAATSYLFGAKRIDSTLVKSGEADIVLAHAYLGLQQNDSARYYANSSFCWINETKNNNSKTLADINLLLSQIEERSKNYSKALDYHKSYSQQLANVHNEDKANAILDTERKYQSGAVQNENIQLSLKHLKIQRLVFLLLLIITISAIVYYRKILKKNRLLSKATIKISNLTDIIVELDKVKAEFDKASKVYKRSEERAKDSFIHNFNILKRAASLEYFVQGAGDKQGRTLIKKFNEIAYGQETIDWDILYQTINPIHDGLFDKIKNKYHHVLDETDFRICCLICSKLASHEISIIMQLSVNTVHMKTSYIRKKLGIKKYGNISDFLSDAVETPIAVSPPHFSAIRD